MITCADTTEEEQDKRTFGRSIVYYIGKEGCNYCEELVIRVTFTCRSLLSMHVVRVDRVI